MQRYCKKDYIWIRHTKKFSQKTQKLELIYVSITDFGSERVKGLGYLLLWPANFISNNQQ